MACLAGSTWVSGASVLRNAQGASPTSLFRYGQILHGMGAYESGIRKLNTQLINIAARRTAGVSRSARLATAHAMADTTSARNLYSFA